MIARVIIGACIFLADYSVYALIPGMQPSLTLLSARFDFLILGLKQ